MTEKKNDLFDSAIERKHEAENGVIEFKADVFEVGKIHTNLQELKPVIKTMCNKYVGLKFTDDQMAEAKTARSNLNSFKKAMNDWRIKKEKEYNQPFLQVKNDIKEMTEVIDSASSGIDAQIKDKENADKEDKRSSIVTFWESNKPEKIEIGIESVWDERYLNKTYTEKQWQSDLQAKAKHINTDVDSIVNSGYYDEQQNYMLSDYQKTLDLGESLKHWGEYQQSLVKAKMAKAEAEERSRKNAEALEAQKQAQEAFKHNDEEVTEQVTEPSQASNEAVNSKREAVYEVSFTATGSVSQMRTLNDAIHSIGIEIHVTDRKKVSE